MENKPHPASKRTGIPPITSIDDKSTVCCYCNKATKLEGYCTGITLPRKCAVCGSIERGRAFKTLFDKELSNSLMGKNILCVAPSGADYNLLKRDNNVTSMAITPGFDSQMDMCDMSTVDSSSIDSFIAIKVFEHCENDLGAFSEVHRVLKPGGLLVFTGSIRISGETTLEPNIHVWYSKEMYDKYRIGSFRRYGAVSLYGMLKDRFNIELFRVKDNLTDTHSVFFVCAKK